MIKYSNIIRYDEMEAGEYFKLPGYSHSFLKGEFNGVNADFKQISDDIVTTSYIGSDYPNYTFQG